MFRTTSPARRAISHALWSRKRTALHLEPLEVRCTPTCRTSLGNGLLTIACDGAADSVALSLENTPPDQVVVTHNQTTQRFALREVQRIALDTGDGNDAVTIVNTLRTTEVRLGNGNDRFEVHAIGVSPPPAPMRVSVEGGAGNDTFEVTPRTQNLGNLASDLVIDGGPTPAPARQEDVLNIHDQNGATLADPATYRITDAQVARERNRPIAYQRISALTVNTTQREDVVTVDLPSANLNAVNTATVLTNGGSDLVNVERVGATWALTVNAGAGNDALLVSPAAQSLANLRGRVTLDGGVPSGVVPQDVLVVYDQRGAANVRSVYNVTSSAVTREASGATLGVTYRNVGYLQLETSDGPDLIRFELTARPPILAAVLTNGGDDTFALTRLPATSLYVDGGSGSDTLDYSAYLTPANPSVTVDLGNGYATGVDFLTGVENALGSVGPDTLIGDANGNRLVGNGGNDYVAGGAGDDYLDGGDGDDYLVGEDGSDIMLGGVGDDYLEGNAGRDFLIGGRGGDLLLGGDDDDLLIGGVTRYDGVRVALEALQAVWTSRLDYAQRVELIYTGVPGGYALNENTVLCDGSVNGLLGEGGQDFFFLTENDYADFDEQETVIVVPCM